MQPAQLRLSRTYLAVLSGMYHICPVSQHFKVGHLFVFVDYTCILLLLFCVVYFVLILATSHGKDIEFEVDSCLVLVLFLAYHLSRFQIMENYI